MEEAIFDPTIPYIGPIYSGQFNPGKVIKIEGTLPATAYRFNITLQCGPESVPRDDVALQMTVRLLDGYVSFNSLINGIWGKQQRGSTFSVKRGEDFEIDFVCDYNQYKVLINDQHYCTFPKRIPHDSITHLAIEGDITVAQISYESTFINDMVDVPSIPATTGSDLDVVKLIDSSPLPEVQSKLSVNEATIEKKLEAEIPEAVPLYPNSDGNPPNLQKTETVDRYYWHKCCALFWGIVLCIIIIFAIVISLADERSEIINFFNITGNGTDGNNTISARNNETFTSNNGTYLYGNDTNN